MVLGVASGTLGLLGAMSGGVVLGVASGVAPCNGGRREGSVGGGWAVKEAVGTVTWSRLLSIRS